MLTVQQRTPSFTRHLLRHAGKWDDGFENGFWDAHWRRRPPPKVNEAIISVRAHNGAPARAVDILTAPEANAKLAKAATPLWGRTLAHARLSGFELCPARTEACTKVCVLFNGHGERPSTQIAWVWRTQLYTDFPWEAGYREGYELARAHARDGQFLYRPDVNSDTAPWRWCARLGEMRDFFQCLGYSKLPEVLGRDAELRERGFHIAYSHNERSNLDREREHLLSGGKIAVVTSRLKGVPPNAEVLREFFGVNVPVVDGDLTDEWIVMDSPLIIDLSAKGKARSLIGRSDFIVSTN